MQSTTLLFILALEQSLFKRYKLAESCGETHDAAVLLAILNAIADARKVL